MRVKTNIVKYQAQHTDVSFWPVWKNPYLRHLIYSFIRGRNAVTAARIGYLDGFKYNVLKGYSFKAMDLAAANGHLAVVKWLSTNRSEGCTTRAIDWAAKNGHLAVVIWLSENRSEGCTKNAMDWAAKNGHLDVVKWLSTNLSEGCSIYAMDYAAETEFWIPI